LRPLYSPIPTTKAYRFMLEPRQQDCQLGKPKHYDSLKSRWSEEIPLAPLKRGNRAKLSESPLFKGVGGSPLIVTPHNAIAPAHFGIVAAHNQIATRYKRIVIARKGIVSIRFRVGE
jgi:hypothetical protein